ncbi:MAG: hypothetical protein AAGD96_21590 [Chloroflexota bacterium]
MKNSVAYCTLSVVYCPFQPIWFSVYFAGNCTFWPLMAQQVGLGGALLHV